MDFLYLQKWIFLISMIFVIVGALNWLTIGAFNFNMVEKVLGVRSPASRAVYVIVGICALAIMVSRDTYLPFLGETVLPCSMIPEHIPENANTQVVVTAEPGTKVLYWAAEPGTEHLKDLKTWRGAYDKYLNSGVVRADGNGKATLLVRRPQPYRVPWKGRLESHVHFRLCRDDGMLGAIKTVFLEDGRVEGFSDL